MFRPRVIPVLLIQDDVLVKSVQFKKHRYIGDPINAVKIFSNFKADELMILDISATKKGNTISQSLITEVGAEANMPFAVGGGISTLQHIQQCIAAGAEKVVIGTAAARQPGFVKAAADAFGSSTICVCMDVNKNFLGRQMVYINNAKKATQYSPVQYAQLMEAQGAGELVIQSVQQDGTMQGYNLGLIQEISAAITIPVVALGGAGNISHMQAAIKANASAVAAGSLFVYQGSKKGVLINYPNPKKIFSS